MRECYNGDDESQWERGKFDPPPLKNPLTDGYQIVSMTTSGISTRLPPCKILSKSVQGFRFCACVISRPSAQSDSAIFWVLEKGYSQDARTDFDEKYIKRRGSAQGSTFWGSRNQYLRFGTPFSSKTVIFGPNFDGT